MMSLTHSDLRRLEIESWIDRATVERLEMRRVDTVEGATLVNRNDREDYAGIIFPIYWPGVDRPREFYLRRDHPPSEGDKPKGKYLAPPGRGNLLMFGRGESPDALADPAQPIVLVEGLKKLVATYRLARHDSEQPQFLTCGISGVWNWKGTIGKTLDAAGARVDEKGVMSDFDDHLDRAQGRRHL